MNNTFRALLIISILLFAESKGYAENKTFDMQTLKGLQETILQQQEQIQRQAEQIRAQSELLMKMQRQIDAIQQSNQSLSTNQEPQSTPQSSTSAHQTAQTTKSDLPHTSPSTPLTLSSADKRLEITLSGQINRAINVISDGGSTDVYPVDNNNSNSRIRLAGSAKIDDDLSLGARMEVAVAPDMSTQVSQISKSSGTWFDQRWTELSLTSAKYGKLSIGKGNTASNTSAEMDLSMTDVIQYATLSDTAGGMFFREKVSGNLTSIRISDVFNSRDGLSRQSRLRYDTPAFYGFTFAGSLVSNQRYDLALFYSNETDALKIAAAAAMADPRIADSGLQYDGSLSMLHKQSGLNLTLSGGMLKRNSMNDAINLYTKLGWIARLIDYGHTAFGVDYTYIENLPVSSDKGYSISVAAVQAFKRIAAEIYFQYRIHSLSLKSAPEVSNINVGTLGLRVRF